MDRFSLALILAGLAALAVDQLAARRGRLPPGFVHPERRVAAGLLLAFILLLTVFFPVVSFDRAPALGELGTSPGEIFGMLFIGPALMLGSLAAWYALGYLGVAGADGPPRATAWLRCFALRSPAPLAELGVGLLAGLAGWMGVLLAMAALAFAVTLLGREDLLATEPPALVAWLVALPVALRLLVSLTAGVVEELFFRGFLQRRVGVGVSTALFVGAHFGYGEPFMLVGVTLLSLFYAFLLRWRGSVWAAISAHALFDALQLLVVLPAALGIGE